MKKYLFFAAALVALVSCSSDSLVGENNNSPDLNPVSASGEKAIVFNSGANTITRATHVGADAADLLGGKFIVEGFKCDATTSAWSDVINNYYVTWTQNTAGTTESNSSDWEYVGPSAAAPSTLPSGAVQSIKYWDYSASQYDFAAYSTGKLTAANVLTSGTPNAGQVLISSIEKNATYAGPTYTLKGDVAALRECYISDLVSAYNPGDFQKVVQLSFRRLASKVRVALYETVPGYSVKNVEFYQDDATTAISANISANTSATLIGVFNKSGEYTVSFPTIGSTNKTKTDYNKAHVGFTADATEGTDPVLAFGTLNYGAADPSGKEDAGNFYLGRTSNAATYAGSGGDHYYTDVLPNEISGALELRINYTLVSTDGSGETITIHGAKAFVPAIYAQWKPNYAYTYIFKISDNTTGWTNTTITDPAGLYPITFDAVVVDAEENTQSTITTVASPSITTYQLGHDITKNEYSLTPLATSTNDSIYVKVMVDGDLKADLNTKAKLYVVGGGGSDKDGNVTEADVMDALNIKESVSGTTTTGRNSWTLTEASLDYSSSSTTTFANIPGVDGNGVPVETNKASRFKPTASTTYAYVYDATPDPAPDVTFIYTARVLTEAPTGSEAWSTEDLWYTKNADGSYSTAPTTFEAGTYYKKYTNQNKTYGVKIIKVQ